jgi:beta-glucosidase
MSKANKRSKTKLWGTLTPILAVLAGVFTAGTGLAYSYSPVVNTYLNFTPYKVVRNENGDISKTEYFKSPYVLKDAKWNGQSSKDGTDAYYDNDALTAADHSLGEEIEGEGAALLFNKDNALPLAKQSGVSAFSISTNNFVYGGTGSGGVDTSTAPKLKTALADASFKVNPTLADFYENGAAKSYKRSVKSFFQTGKYAINEAPWSIYTDEVKNSFATYGDAAIVVLSRVGGEDNDLPRTLTDYESNREGKIDWTNPNYLASLGELDNNSTNDGEEGNYLRLSAQEKEIFENLKTYKDNGVFKKVVVLLNSCNPIQCDFLTSNKYGVDAAMWVGAVGQTGINAVADLLSGDINPSGSLTDTFYNDNLGTPTMVNYGKTKFKNFTADDDAKGLDAYAVYEENIYNGYKYAESRYFDTVMGTNNAGKFDYSSLVAYPFGSGESYTTFSYSDFRGEEKDNNFIIHTKVTNTGSKYSGKEPVQIYMSSPYTDYDKENSIEKSAVELVGFGKTGMLAPGASEILDITIPKESMKTYDAFKAKTYVVDSGSYYFTAATDAHQAANNILNLLGKNANDGMVGTGNANLVYTYNQKQFDDKTYSLSSATDVKITNQFDNADLRIHDNAAQKNQFNLLSRNNWTKTYPIALTDRSQGNLQLTSTLKEEATTDADIIIDEDKDAKMPAYSKQNGLNLAMMRGLSYDNEAWGDLLDQMSYDDQQLLCSAGYHQTQTIESIGKPATKDENGPIGLTKSFMGSTVKCMSYPSCPVMGATLNTELIHKMGEQIGLDALHANYQGLYGPGVNIHRSPYAGRNFEYFSEDSLLSGLICEAETKGIQSKGMYVYAKHFALNDMETCRHGICVFASEQTIRQSYLKSFEYVLSSDKGNGHASMTSFNRIGTVWAGADKNLLTNVLRKEWGFDGFTLSDCWTDIADTANSGNRFGNAPAAVMAGGDSLDGRLTDCYSADYLKKSPTFCQALRESAKRICYVVANSSAMNGISSEDTIVSITPWWKTTLVSIDCVCWAGFAASCTMLVLGIIKNKKLKASSVETNKQ